MGIMTMELTWIAKDVKSQLASNVIVMGIVQNVLMKICKFPYVKNKNLDSFNLLVVEMNLSSRNVTQNALLVKILKRIVLNVQMEILDQEFKIRVSVCLDIMIIMDILKNV